MNKLLLLCLFISLIFYNQDFEGKIEYKTSYKVLSDKESEASLKNDLGTKMTFIVKNGFTKEISNAAYGNLHIFNPIENRIYFTDSFSPNILFYTNGKKAEPNKNVKYKVVKNAEIILGHKCDKLIYIAENYEIVYFYSPDLKYDPKYTKNFTYTNKNEKVAIMKSIFLKQVMTTKNFIATVEAVKITPQKISDKEFDKPKHKVLKEE